MKKNNNNQVEVTNADEIKSFKDFFTQKEEEKIKDNKNSKINSFKDFFKINNEKKDLVEDHDVANPKDIEGITKLLKSIKTSITEEINKNGKIQSEIIDLVKGTNEPSVDLTTFFKKYNYEIKPFFQSTIEREVKSISEDLKNKDYLKNIKLISKNKDSKLDSEFKQFKEMLTGDFLTKVKAQKSLTLRDQAHVSRVLSNLSSFISDVKYYTPEEAITAATK